MVEKTGWRSVAEIVGRYLVGTLSQIAACSLPRGQHKEVTMDSTCLFLLSVYETWGELAATLWVSHGLYKRVLCAIVIVCQISRMSISLFIMC